MFNLLTDKLPSSIDIGGGSTVDIKTDFRVFIEFEKVFFGKNELTKKQKVLHAFHLFGEYIPTTENEVKAYMDGIIDIYRCGKEIKKLNPKIEKKANNIKTPKYFDFDFDSPYIFAAFMQTYGIDLTDTDMHWYKFKALFDALPADCQFSKIISYRGADITKIKDQSEKERIIKLQTIYALPRSLSESDKIAEVGRIFSGGKI